MSKPIVARVTTGPQKGAEYGFATEKDAERILGKGAFAVVRYGDGSPVEKPKPAPKTDKKDGA